MLTFKELFIIHFTLTLCINTLFQSTPKRSFYVWYLRTNMVLMLICSIQRFQIPIQALSRCFPSSFVNSSFIIYFKSLLKLEWKYKTQEYLIQISMSISEYTEAIKQLIILSKGLRLLGRNVLATSTIPHTRRLSPPW